MSESTPGPFSTERELAEERQDDDPAATGAAGPADKAPPPSPPADEDAVAKGVENLTRVKPY